MCPNVEGGGAPGVYRLVAHPRLGAERKQDSFLLERALYLIWLSSR